MFFLLYLNVFACVYKYELPCVYTLLTNTRTHTNRKPIAGTVGTPESERHTRGHMSTAPPPPTGNQISICIVLASEKLTLTNTPPNVLRRSITAKRGQRPWLHNNNGEELWISFELFSDGRAVH